MTHIYAIATIILLVLILGAVRTVAKNQVQQVKQLAAFRTQDERRRRNPQPENDTGVWEKER